MFNKLKLIGLFDDKDYPETTNYFKREASRAIILYNDKIALVKSQKEGFYKFPGGGIKNGENPIDALIRETKEEVGLNIIPSTIRPFGYTLERRKSTVDNDQVFEQKSYYYLASVTNMTTNQDLDDYEKELGYVLEIVDLDEAYKTNSEMQDHQDYPYIKREAYILKAIQRFLKNGMVFYDTNFLRNDEIYLRLSKTCDILPEKDWLPSYRFDICLLDDTPIGKIDLRIGHNHKTYYGGNIGYEAFEPYRGNHYASKACLLLFGLARLHDMKYLYITCDPSNIASAKTCISCGGELVEIAKIPLDNEMYLEQGKTHVNVYICHL